MSEDTESTFLQSLGRGFGMLLIIVVLAVALMGLIFGVAKFLTTERPAVQTLPSPGQSEAARQARTEAKFAQPAAPYAPEAWPTYPGRRGGGRATGASQGSGAPTEPSAAETPKPAVPVGIPVEEYQAAVASGKKLFLPDPKGECNVGGANPGGPQALANCFAAQAAR